MKKYLQPDWPAPANIKAYTTLRHAWGEGDYKSAALRTALTPLLNLPNDPIWLDQVHANRVVAAEPNNLNQQADACYTKEPNQVCVIVTADCLPILITNQQGSEIAAIHAGWRSLASGIIENTIEALRSNPEELLVWLGPAIGPEKFEVGVDVYEAFTHSNAEASAAFIPHTKDKWLANLYTLAKLRLDQYKIKRVYGGNFCTYTQSDLFHSYRRDKPPLCGRMANVIWITQ